MCGIVGYVGPREAPPILVSGLRKLEYRGYDSAGLATISDRHIEVRRSVGKLDNLDAMLAAQPLRGTPGVGHTRWATHGRPSEQNAHPHRAGKVVVIHNGIIENFLELRRALAARGRTMASETDTEVISHLIDEFVAQGHGLAEATRRAIAELEGSFAIVVLSESEPDRLVAAKNATPIVLGLGDGENFVASDIPAMLEHTRRVVFLEDGEVVELTRRSGRHHHLRRRSRSSAPPKVVAWDAVTAQKGGFKHFLLKEIHEQPQAIIDTHARPHPPGGGRRAARRRGDGQRADRRRALRAGRVRHRVARVPGRQVPDREPGGHSRARSTTAASSATAIPSSTPKTLLVVVSQSGETADTLAAVEAGRERGTPVLAVCNVVDSSIARAIERRALHPRRSRDQRRQHEGVHHAAHRALPAGALPGAAAWHASMPTAGASC